MTAANYSRLTPYPGNFQLPFNPDFNQQKGHPYQGTSQESILVRIRGKVRVAVKIGLMNLTYNMRRLEFLLRPQSVWSAG